MMFVFIQFCLHIICQSRIWCKGYEQSLQILFPDIVGLVSLTLPITLDVFYVMTTIIEEGALCFVDNTYL